MPWLHSSYVKYSSAPGSAWNIPIITGLLPGSTAPPHAATLPLRGRVCCTPVPRKKVPVLVTPAPIASAVPLNWEASLFSLLNSFFAFLRDINVTQ